MSEVKTEVDYDHQHGPIVRLTIGGTSVAVYIADETAVACVNGKTHGLSVDGPWYKFREGMNIQLTECQRERDSFQQAAILSTKELGAAIVEIARLQAQVDRAQDERNEAEARAARLEGVLQTARWALREPFDGWKSECERKALDAINAALESRALEGTS